MELIETVEHENGTTEHYYDYSSYDPEDVLRILEFIGFIGNH